MASLVIRSERLDEGRLLVALFGSLDIFSCWKFQAFFDEKPSSMGQVQQVLVDLSGVIYINSSAWTVLLGQRKALNRCGGEMVLFGMRPEIKRVYEIMTIHHMLPLAESLEEAGRLLKDAADNWIVPDGPGSISLHAE